MKIKPRIVFFLLSLFVSHYFFLFYVQHRKKMPCEWQAFLYFIVVDAFPILLIRDMESGRLMNVSFMILSFFFLQLKYIYAKLPHSRLIPTYQKNLKHFCISFIGIKFCIRVSMTKVIMAQAHILTSSYEFWKEKGGKKKLILKNP